ncbi:MULTISPECIES: hypothetical protein [unclassified Micromonospora]|uniref:hypothetical protein n=1 Tax=unclassified Micromonospora TaxID=2617518 RepID=UPI003334876A
MAEPFATPEQVAAVFRPLTAAEAAIVAARLAAASRMLRGRFPDLDARIAAGTLDPDLAADAAVAMVLRVIRKPGALAGVGNLKAEATGPFRRDYYPDEDGDLDLVVTDAEVALLTPPQIRARRPAGTIRVQAGLAPAPPYQRRVGENHVRFW